MKNLLLLVIGAMLTIYVSQAQSSWQIVSSPVNENFVSICFLDESNGWIISETGTIVSTSDAGNIWETISYPDVHFRSIHFSDSDHGCIVGWQETPADSSLILTTFDGGENWIMVDHFRVNRLNDVFFINNNIGWAVGSYTYEDWILNCCLYTSDGGQSWGQQSSITVVDAELYGVHFRDENTGQACGYDGAFFLTNNGGSSWAMNIATPAPLLNLNAIFNWGVLTGCMVGEEGTALYTTNNWYQYIETVTNTTENLNGVSGDPVTNKLWAAGDNGTIIYTPSYLLGWAAQPTGVSENLNDIQMLSETNGWAVGDNGTILHFSPATAICHNNKPQIDVYPNPVDDVLNIHLDNRFEFHQIQLFNSNGKLIYKRDIDNITEILVEVSQLSPGIYHLKTNGESANIITKVLIK